MNKEDVNTAKKLQAGEKCIVQGFGQPMMPIIRSGQKCEIMPVLDDTVLEKGDIVFVKINGRFYLHKISAIKGDQFQISNNHKHVNGWIGRNNIINTTGHDYRRALVVKSEEFTVAPRFGKKDIAPIIKNLSKG